MIYDPLGEYLSATFPSKDAAERTIRAGERISVGAGVVGLYMIAVLVQAINYHENYLEQSRHSPSCNDVILEKLYCAPARDLASYVHEKHESR